jgi:hypothetical protein
VIPGDTQRAQMVPESPLFWTLVVASVPVAAATLYWATKKTYDTYVPYQVSQAAACWGQPQSGCLRACVRAPS